MINYFSTLTELSACLYTIVFRRRIACITALEQKRCHEATKDASQELKNATKKEVVMTSIEGKEVEEAEELMLTEIPEECVREILLRLSDAKDLDTAGDDDKMPRTWTLQVIMIRCQGP